MTRLPATRSCRNGRRLDVLLMIDGRVYQVSPLDVDGAVGLRAFRFTKAEDGTAYDLLEGRHGLECDCRGFVRHGHCKHAAALTAAGRMFGAPAGASADPAADPFARLGEPAWFGPVTGPAGRWPTDAELDEAMAEAPPLPEPTAEEVEAMARYFGQQ